MHLNSISVVTILLSVFLTACGGGGSGNSSNSTPPPQSLTYSISGTLHGLAPGNSITLANNGSDNITLTANGPFSFLTKLASGATYNLSIVTLPLNEPCTATYGVGTVAAANITSINVTCTLTATGSTLATHAWPVSTALNNGKILMVDSSSTTSNNAELYDPSTGQWTSTGSLIPLLGVTNRKLTPLSNGLVLMTGANGTTQSSELYDPSTGAWSVTGSLITIQRPEFSSLLLGTGKVLVTGGMGCCFSLTSSELYDPVTGSWSATGNLITGRQGHTATLLSNGKVLVVGGANCPGSFCTTTYLSSAEIYDPLTGSWSSTGSMASARGEHTATLLSNGKVLVTGGRGLLGDVTTSELYDPTTGTWGATGNLQNRRSSHTATLLPSGKVLVTGGFSQLAINITSTELYDPATGSWSESSSLITGRYGHTATLLSNSHVLISGGVFSVPGGQPVAISSAELYW